MSFVIICQIKSTAKSCANFLVDVAGVVLRPLGEWLSIVDEIDYKAEAGS